MCTRRVHKCSTHTPLVRFVHISTDEVYGDSDMGDNVAGKQENTPLVPSNPYAATKVHSMELRCVWDSAVTGRRGSVLSQLPHFVQNAVGDGAREQCVRTESMGCQSGAEIYTARL